MDENEIERETIECIFCLGGGELETEHWEGYAYWYDGAPEYARRELEQDGYTYRTVIVECLWGFPEAPTGWERVAVFRSSGESDCWRDGPGTDEEPSPDCPLCEGNGFAYLGEGYAEVVFRAPDE